MDAGSGNGWHIHYGHIKLGNNNNSRVEFNNRPKRVILKELGDKINRYNLAITGNLRVSFEACINYIKNNY